MHAVCWNVGIQDNQLESDSWLYPIPLGVRLRQMQELVLRSRADVIMFQECGNHTTVRDRDLVRTQSMESLRLDEHFDLEVHQSYWTLWRRRTVKIVSVDLRPCPGNVSTREWQTAQVLVVEPVLQGDAADSRVTFVNLHLPCSQKRKLTTERRKAHFRAACEIAGDRGVIMGDLNTNGSDRRPLPRQEKPSF